jgi:uncharacterized protein
MERQKGLGKGHQAQQGPAPPSRNSESAPAGDRTGMGHCHTSAQFGRDSEPCGPDGRTAEASAARQAARELSHQLPNLRLGRRSLGAWILLAFVRFYIAFLSPFFGGACKFYPSCSNYAIEAVSKHGAGRGIALAAKRLLRCRPFTQGGFDPVPDELPHPAREERRAPVFEDLRPKATERRTL